MTHGSVSTYVYYKCRCDACRGAKRAADREYYQRNRKRVGTRTAAYRAENRKAIRMWFKEHHQRNKETLLARKQEWRATPEGKQETRRANLKRRARVLDCFVEHVDTDRVLLRDCGICGICGERIEAAFHVDHIVPLSRGGKHGYENVQLAHAHCNLQKAAA